MAGEKLAEQITAGPVQLHHVKAGPDGPGRRPAEITGHPLPVGLLHHPPFGDAAYQIAE